MTPIVCSDCGEVSLETSRTVVLPFVCAGCQKRETSTSHHDADPSDCHTAPDETLSDDTATTDATVELISDLESQLAVAKELSQARTELIEQLEKQNGSLRQHVDSLKAASRVLIDASPFLIEVASALAFHYGYATEKLKQVEKQNAELRDGLILRDEVIETLQYLSGIDLVIA